MLFPITLVAFTPLRGAPDLQRVALPPNDIIIGRSKQMTHLLRQGRPSNTWLNNYHFVLCFQYTTALSEFLQKVFITFEEFRPLMIFAPFLNFLSQTFIIMNPDQRFYNLATY